jgi:peptide/nickel transport system substrate-binding protein
MTGTCLRIFLTILLSVCIIAGCRGGNREKYSPDTLVAAITSEPKNLNPVFLSDLVSYTVSGLIFNGLTKFDKDMKITGDLAASWDILQGGREIVFHLKKGTLWHDGAELTADDVVFTYNTMVSPVTATHLSGVFGPVKEVKASDRYTVSVRYSKPYGSALESWTAGIIPKHVLQNRDMRNMSFFDDAPIGTGPYRLKEWARGQKLRLESFDGYHAGRPGIRNLIIRIIPDAATQLMELKAGTVDIMELSPLQFGRGTGPDQVSSGFNKYRTGSFRYGFLGLNLLDKRFQDKRVRQALSYAIDKDLIISTVFMGFGSRSSGPYPPEAWYYSPAAKYYHYDPRKALELLEQAGWNRGTDGILRKNSVPFYFSILTNYESKENIKTAQIIQSNLKAIGIQADILTLDWQAFRHNVVSQHQFEAIVLSRSYLWDPDIYDLWHSSRTKKGEWNFLSYNNPEADRILESGRATVAAEERKQIYRKAHELLADDQACIFLYNADLLFIAHKRIKGIAQSPAGMFYNVAEWHIEK